MSGQQVGPGTLIYLEEKASPMPLMKASFTITDWIDNKKMFFTMNSGPSYLKRCEGKWLIEAISSGSRVSYVEDVEFSFGILGRLLGFLGRWSAEANTRKIMSRLKNLVEAKE